MNAVKLSIEGMSCGRCVEHVSTALSALDGVKVERVAVGSAEISLDPDKSSPVAVVRALAGIGYPAQVSGPVVAGAGDAPDAPQKEGCGCCHKSLRSSC